MRGLYDRRGECFGYVVGSKVYDLEHRQSGTRTPKEILDLTGQRVWHIDRDGLYDEHWQCIGFIGSPVEDNHDYR
ncbi:MAG: hypothetical protein KJ064_10405 [Anaerolineae bacterium]|nr:MAG: hypothetical protein F9K27_11685 [Anaerolineae bacterium]MCL4877062.1 hypothetical protein [Anaerolineae bacterium]